MNTLIVLVTLSYLISLISLSVSIKAFMTAKKAMVNRELDQEAVLKRARESDIALIADIVWGLWSYQQQPGSEKMTKLKDWERFFRSTWTTFDSALKEDDYEKYVALGKDVNRP